MDGAGPGDISLGQEGGAKSARHRRLLRRKRLKSTERGTHKHKAVGLRVNFLSFPQARSA